MAEAVVDWGLGLGWRAKLSPQFPAVPVLEPLSLRQVISAAGAEQRTKALQERQDAEGRLQFRWLVKALFPLLPFDAVGVLRC